MRVHHHCVFEVFDGGTNLCNFLRDEYCFRKVCYFGGLGAVPRDSRNHNSLHNTLIRKEANVDIQFMSISVPTVL